MAWQDSDPGLFRRVGELVTAELPTFHLEINHGTVFLRGSLQLADPDGKVEIERYDVEIELRNGYPETVPLVREVGGRIPHIPNRHFNDDGGACLFVEDERWRFYSKETTIVQFVSGPVRNFFLNQASFDATGKFIFGERPHGVEGIADYYFEELSTRDPDVVLCFLRYLSSRQVKGHWDCYCGSGQRLRKCHFAKLLDLRKKIPPETAANSLEKLQAYFRRVA